MKKLFLKLLASVTAGIGIVIFGAGLASAQTSISNTGPNSDNRIIIRNTTRVDIDNDTDIDCAIRTTQNASTGNASVIGNTTGGSATTGDASNSSSSSCNVNVNNSVGRVPKPGPAQGPGGGQGGGVVSGVSTTSKVRTGAGQVAAADIVALPNTGENTLLKNIVGMAIGFMSVTAIWQLGLGLYRRLAIGQLSNFAI